MTANLSRFAPLLILFLALVSFGIGLAELPVQDRDEARFAQAARQMAETGELIDIRFLDQPRHNKPALIYWLQSAAIWITGSEGATPIWVHRLPSYIAGVLSALALIWTATPLVGRRAAILAGIMCATCYMLHAEARTAKTDAALLLAVILSMGALARIWLNQAQGWITPAIFWTALAAGFLLKGPMVALPIAGAVVWCSWQARSLRWLGGLKPLAGVPWFLLLAAPWYVAITIITDGAFWAASLGADLADKVMVEGEHSARPPGLYLVTMWLTLWPWSILIPLGLVQGWATRKTPQTAFLLGWLVPGWLVFEAVPVKLIHYTMPLYPALMMLAAAALVAILDGDRRFTRWVGGIGSIGFLAGLGFFVFVMVAVPLEYGDGLNPISLLAAAVMSLCALYAIASLWRQNIPHAVASLAAAGVIMGTTLTAVTLPAARSLWVSERLVEAMSAHSCLSGTIGLPGYREPSAVFLFGGNIWQGDATQALAALEAAEITAAWLLMDDQTPPGIPGLTQVDGISIGNFRPVSLRLYVAPGVPAPPDPCG